MKKIVIGTTILVVSPFVVILGSWLLNVLKLHEGAFIFASILGGLTICVNYFVGVLMIIQGHKENGTLDQL